MKPKNIFFRTPFNYDTDEASELHGLTCTDESLAKQEFKDDANPNQLFGRYLETGTVPMRTDMPRFTDYHGIFDYMTARNAIRKAEEDFANLPVKIRNRFNNSPQDYLDFVNDEENAQEGVKLGLWTLEDLTPATPPKAPPAKTAPAPAKQAGDPKPGPKGGAKGSDLDEGDQP